MTASFRAGLRPPAPRAAGAAAAADLSCLRGDRRSAPGVAARHRPATLAEWLAHVDGLHAKVIELGLERVREVKARLGLAPRFPLIVVGGTNGKGSTCAMLEAMLGEAGYRVGCYTSPHFLRYNERVRVDGRMADDAALCRSFAEVERARRSTPLTYFEFGTLAAVALFRAAEVEVAVLEVGLGGRLDAVNVFDADCAVVTGIDIDHVDYLGDTREAIGHEKAGIFRAGRPAVCGDANPPRSVGDHAAAIGANLVCAGKHFGYEAAGDSWRYRQAGRDAVELPRPQLRGGFQLANASAAIATLDQLRHRLPVADAAIRAGLRSAFVPGRFQVLHHNPKVIIDVAHNPQAAAALAENLAAAPGAARTTAVFAMLADKDIRGVVRHLMNRVDAWHVAGLDQPRGASAAQVAAALHAEGVRAPVFRHPSPLPAYAAALGEAHGSGARVVVFGSFYTVTAVLADAAGAALPQCAG